MFKMSFFFLAHPVYKLYKYSSPKFVVELSSDTENNVYYNNDSFKSEKV